MKTGRTLNDLAAEIVRQQESKKDYVAPAKRLHMELPADQDGRQPILVLDNGNGGVRVAPTQLCHQQVGDRLGIPKVYYDRMRAEAPALLAGNVNHWFSTGKDNYLVRTLDGGARAFLSDRYRPLDNHDLAEAVLPIIAHHKWQVKSCELTETRMYLKIVSTDITAMITHGRHGNDHICHPGLTISNSEVGLGAVRVEPSVHWPHCLNLATMDSAGTSRFHLGRKDVRFGDVAQEFFTDATRQQDDKAFWMKVRDVVQATLSEELFRSLVEQWQNATLAKIDGDPVKVIELTAKRYGLNETERASVLRHLITDGDLSLYGLSGAITRMAQDETVDYDRATQLERLGGTVIEMPKESWRELQAA